MFTSKQQAVDWAVKNLKAWPTEIPKGAPRGLTWLFNGREYLAAWDNVTSHAVTKADWLEAKAPESLADNLKSLLHDCMSQETRNKLQAAIDTLTWQPVDSGIDVPKGEWLCEDADGTYTVQTFPQTSHHLTGREVIKAYRRI